MRSGWFSRIPVAPVMALMIGCPIAGAAQPATGQDSPEEESRGAAGAESSVASDGDVEVWIHPVRRGEDLGLDLVVVNLGDEPVDVYPQRIRVEAVEVVGGEEKRRRLRTYHPDQYEAVLKRRAHVRGSVGLDVPRGRGGRSSGSWTPRERAGNVSASGASSSACRTGAICTPVQSTFSQNPAKRSGGNVPGPGMGPRPAGADGAAGVSLLRPQLLEGKGVAAGRVYLKYRAADYYHTHVPVGDHVLELDFRIPDRGEDGDR